MSLDLLALQPLCSSRRGQTKKKPTLATPRAVAERVRAAFVANEQGVERALRSELPDAQRKLHRAALDFARDIDAEAFMARGLDVDVQACAVHVLTGVFINKETLATALLPCWLAEGPGFAVHALARASEGAVKWDFGRDDTCVWDPEGQWDGALERAFPAWEAMRDQLSWLSPEEREEARKKASEIRKGLSPAVQCALAYLFPSEPDWAADAASAWLALPSTAFTGLLTLGSLTNLQLAERVLREASAGPGLEQIGTFAGDFAMQFGEAALPLLLEIFARTTGPKETWNWAKTSLTKLAKVLACYDDVRVTQLLMGLLDDKLFGPVANDHLMRFPQSAIRLLTPSRSERSKKAERRVALLDTLVRLHPEFAQEGTAELKPTHAGGPDRPVASVKSEASEAAKAAWPGVLAAPPWRSKNARGEVPILRGLVVPELTPRLLLDDATRAHWAPPAYMGSLSREQQEAALSTARKNVNRTTKLSLFSVLDVGAEHGGYVFINGFAFDEDVLLAMWELPPVSSDFNFAHTCYALVRLNERGIAGTLTRLEVDASLLPAAAYIDSTKVSPHLARALRRPSQRALAQRALARAPRTHSLGLIPLALSAEGRDADLAGVALRWLAANGHLATILESAASYGPEASEATKRLLALNPLEICPVKPPRLSEFADAVALPPVRLRDGAFLPTEAVRNLLEMLQFSPQDPPYAGIADVVQACDRASLDAFAWALLQAWDRAGGSSANAWALHALGHLGSDSVVKLLAAEIRRWPREKAKPRALLGLDVLARMGTDVALLHLDELSKKARNRDVEAKAKDLLAQVAETRGLSPEDLEDRLVPTLDLDAQGARTLAIGPRILKVQFNEALVPYLVDAEGKRSEKVAKAKGDDADALKQAQDAWKELRGDAAQIAKALIGRLERAMCEERRWETEDFRSLFIAHPLTRQLATRLIWGVFAEEGGLPTTTFRIAEDASLATLDDALMTLSDTASLGIVHPYYLDEAERTAWGERLAEYEILQPFEQLGRRVERVQKGSEKEVPWAAAQGKMVGLGPLLGAMEARGWRVASPDGDGLMDHMTRMFGTRSAVIGFAPGFRPREARPERVQISVSLGSYRTLANVPPIAYAEITRDLASLGLM